MSADLDYQRCIQSILQYGDRIVTRNSPVYTNHLLTPTTFFSTPLVQFRKTAWKKAISEMEWFISGMPKCPDNLLDWWSGQLDPWGRLLNGYGCQLRHSSQEHSIEGFDQIKFILDGIKNSPNSRRLVMSVWNPGEMARITDTNMNQNTPTCCHSIVVQFFVRNGALHMTSYQRSADMLLGVPHNWIQSWALLLYFAYHSNLNVGSMQWLWGDAHIYDEFSHMDIASRILGLKPSPCDFKLIYSPTAIEDDYGIPKFKASDFTYTGTIATPQITDKPALL